ncbi:CotH kinase family protein [Desulfonema magnum]|uniref:Kinase domain-containing protein n=1 Tax=Desulfonema magnum TaxID=45655 RepID=A0A975BH60_9BACT|nr:CotH kinase family protein [Desulfonema magnum]QTA85654.1 Kinase domain-containing protein [Desulfonema magnum]
MTYQLFSNKLFGVCIIFILLTGGNLLADSSNSLFINEFMASNSSKFADPQGEYDDWIEIYNKGDDPVSLMGMYLTDDLTNPAKWQFPDITLEPGGFLIVWADEDLEDEGMHCDFKLSASGEALGLFNADQTAVDTVTFEAQSENISFGRYTDGSDDWQFFSSPSPGTANTDTVSGDTDGNGTVDMADAIIALKIFTGMPTTLTAGDINGDGKSGLEEVIYIVRKLSEVSKTSEAARPEGWNDETHGNEAVPDYDAVFSDGQVRKIELIIDPADWQAMMDDMTDIYGEFGTDGNQPPADNNQRPQQNDQFPNDNQPPGDNQMIQAATDACVGKNEGDACTMTMQEQTVSGSCISDREVFVCRPDNMDDEILGDQMPDGGIPDDGMAGGGDQMPDAGKPDGGMEGDGNLELADRNPIWKPCTFRFENKVWNHVGVRFKGNSSLSSTWRSGIWKLPFRFDFDQFEDDYPEIDNQRFYGFKQLTLSSSYKDDSLIREKVAADIFRDAGVPAPRTAFYRVYIDHGEGSEYFGLYTMVEVPADPMLDSYFGNSDGNLYKPEGSGATFATFDMASFDKETNEDEADRSDIIALFDALHSSRDNATAWRACLEKTLNVDGFLRWLAVNTLIQNWDTYGAMTHNFYLYTNSEDGRINWIPWDNNEALKGSDSGDRGSLSLSLAEVTDSWPLIRYLADDPAYWEKYVSFIGETARGAFEPEKMKAIYQAASDLIRPYVVGDEGEKEGYTFLNNAAEFDAAIEYLNTHVEARYEAALEFIEK